MVDTKAFTFIISLAAVINGLGIVRWITTLAEFLRRRNEVKVKVDLAYCMFAVAQFLFHIIFWWTIWGLREVTDFNFLKYLYVLLGPVFLYLGTTLLAPNSADEKIDLAGQYESIRRDYWTIFGLLFLWALFLAPLLMRHFSPAAPVFVLFIISAGILRQSTNTRLTLPMAFVNWIILLIYIFLYAMKFGGVVVNAG